MEIKKFEAFTMQDAVKLVRQELGKDAVILSTKEKLLPSDQKGQKNIKMVEILAAKSGQMANGNQNRSTLRTPDFPRIQRTDAASVVKGPPAATRLPHPETKRLAQALAPQLQQTPTPATPSRNTGASTHTAAAGNSSDWRPDLDLLREDVRRIRQDLAQIPHLNIADQMNDLKIMIHDLLRRESASDTAAYPPALLDLGVKLRTGGVAESVISLLFQETDRTVKTAVDVQTMSTEKLKEVYLNTAIKCILKKMSLFPFLQDGAAHTPPYLCCLVGPAGSGKTTAIAKSAAYLKLEKKKKIALVSLDTYRIAGSDQLRIYSKILECPFLEASDPDEIIPFIKKQSDAQYVFIDTPGYIPQHSENHSPLAKVMQLDLPIHLHLVLPGTMKQRDLDEVTKSFSPLGIESLLFTKLDESWGYGEIFTTAIRSQLPLSYFSLGQRVPEDLVTATKERIIERLFSL